MCIICALHCFLPVGNPIFLVDFRFPFPHNHLHFDQYREGLDRESWTLGFGPLNPRSRTAGHVRAASGSFQVADRWRGAVGRPADRGGESAESMRRCDIIAPCRALAGVSGLQVNEQDGGSGQVLLWLQCAAAIQ